MNTKLSGAQLVLVPITQMGRNYFPLVENLRGRVIKFIDFYPANYLPDTDAAGLAASADMFVTIKNDMGNTDIHCDLPLERFDYAQTLGVRQPICSKISLPNCYVLCRDANNVGKTAAFLCWYDLPEYSQRNTTDTLITDALTIPITTYVRYNQLPDSDRMTGKRFRRLLLGVPSVTPDQTTGMPQAQLSNIYLTLRKGSYNICENIPLPLLWQMQMLHKSEFQNIIFDLQSSYLTIGGAGTIPNVQTDYVGKSVFLNLQYEK